MNKWTRRSIVGVVAVVGIAAAAAAVAVVLGERRMQRTVDVAVAPLAVGADAKSVERGRYLFAARGCADCHGVDGAGHVVIDDGKGMFVRAPNLTAGGTTARYTGVDWARTLRHGVKPDGRPLMVMPSEDYARFVDADVVAVAAYVATLPRASGGAAEVRLPLPVKALYGIGAIRDASEKIDHRLPPAQPVPEGVTVAHGAYVANACLGCHGPKLLGGRIPGTPPDWPPASRLAPGADSAMARYPTDDAFMAMFRSGRRPDGSSISKVMPFPMLGAMSDVDVRALHLYLKGLPAP